MSWFDYFVLVTLSLVTLISFIMAIQFRNQLIKMGDMVVSMTIGMNVGLTAGLLFGSIYQGNLYFSTIISILAGAVAGTICGLTFGVLPILEGFMAGLMGGMMGAMLGEMISPSQADTLLNIFLTLSVCSLILFPILHESNKKETTRKKRKWLFKPLITFLFLSVYLILGNQFDKLNVLSKFTSTQDKYHIHGTKEKIDHPNYGQKEFPIISSELIINVHPSSFNYDPKKIMLKKGQKVRLIFNNLDLIEHDIEIKHFPSNKQTEGHEGHAVQEADFHLHANPNSKAETIFTPIENGSYEFYCTIPGHRDSGMTGIIVVD